MTTGLNLDLIRQVFLIFDDDPSPESRPAFLNALCVSSQFYEIGKPILWLHIVAGPARLHALLEPDSTANLTLVRSLTIVWPRVLVRPEERARSWNILIEDGKKLVTNPIKRLPQLLSRMKNLNSFSFSVGPRVPSIGTSHSTMIHVNDLVRMIESLSASVNDLELDMHSNYILLESEEEPLSLCHTIAERLQGLKHARIRTGAFCKNIFAPSTTLQTIVFPLIHGIGPRGISVRSCQYCARLGNPDNPQMEAARPNSREQFIAKVKVQLRHCPSLTKALAISTSSRYWKEHDHDFTAVDVRSIIQDQTTTGLLEFHASMDVTLRWGIADLCRDYEGSLKAIASLLENGGWRSNQRGVRAYDESGAMSMYNSLYRVAPTRPFEGLDIETWKKAKEDCYHQSYLWGDEIEAGRVLVLPWTTPGVGEVNEDADYRRDSGH